MIKHKIKLRLAAAGNDGELNMVELDGKPILVSAIKIERDVDSATVVHLTLPAVEVEGEMEVDISDLTSVARTYKKAVST